MPKTPFYASGLRFSCVRCSSCCRHESGFVFLCEEDLELLTGKLNMDYSIFVKIYCRWVPGEGGEEYLSLREKPNFDCIFWDSVCTVYNARPQQCRTFPFWKSVVNSREAWESTASGCPGMNSGKLHDIESIESCLTVQPKIKKVKFGEYPKYRNPPAGAEVPLRILEQATRGK